MDSILIEDSVSCCNNDGDRAALPLLGPSPVTVSGRNGAYGGHRLHRYTLNSQYVLPVLLLLLNPAQDTAAVCNMPFKRCLMDPDAEKPVGETSITRCRTPYVEGGWRAYAQKMRPVFSHLAW